MLAISGGGSRAAYLSSVAMLKLQQQFSEIDLLKEVDVMSSVSGGSLAAAYYAVSKDPIFTINIPRCNLDCSAFSENSNIKCSQEKKTLSIATASKQERLKSVKDVLLAACPDKGEQERLERLFEISTIEVKSNRLWEYNLLKDLMSRDYRGRWIANWFWPYNIARYWFTAYDRSDLMAKTFEDNLFDVYPTGEELTFANLNPERPYLILNATEATEKYSANGSNFSDVFPFTQDFFRDKLNSDINQYSVARAVMATAAFPGVFSYMTLADLTDDNNRRYHHVFDGGNADNLGLSSLKDVIRMNDGYRHYIVILIDAFVEPRGKDSTDPDPRGGFSYILDTNFMDSFDALLSANRKGQIENFVHESGSIEDKFTFWHLTFQKISKDTQDLEKPEKRSGLRDALNRIPTDFRISDDNKDRIEKAVDVLFEKDRACLDKIKNILLGKEVPTGIEDPCDTTCFRNENCQYFYKSVSY